MGKVFWAALAAVVLVLVALLLWPEVAEDLAPEPTVAWVAIEPEGAGVARVGPVEIAAGTPFRLHAVLEAETRRGETIYYTEAPALGFGDERVPEERIRLWNRPQPVKIRWFTVEGELPWFPLEGDRELADFDMTEFLRVDWPNAWTIPGRLEPAFDDSLALDPVQEKLPFGTQRYHVRIEVFPDEDALVAERRYTSWGAAEAWERPGEFPTVVASLAGAAAVPSGAFGLTVVGPPAPVPGELGRELVELTEKRLAVAPTTLFAALLTDLGLEPGEVPWRRIELPSGLAWGEAVGAGDLVRVGDRWVVLWRDGDEDGTLDRADLCFDYVQGAAVRPLSEVFGGGDAGEVDWAPLASLPPRPSPENPNPEPAREAGPTEPEEPS